jgi:transaldolase
VGIGSPARRAVFLDRDGVINRPVVRDGKPYPPAGLGELELLPGVAEALARLHDAGFRLVLVTNQPDIARGTQSRQVVDQIHAELAQRLPIDEFKTCPHDDRDGCACRKPKPGLLKEAALTAGIHLVSSFMVGDRWRDIEAGHAAGCQTVFIDYHYNERRPRAPDVTVDSLAEAAEWILRQEEGSKVKRVNDLSVRIFADGADLAGMREMYRQPFIKGFTTNPTLMRRAGVADYAEFARDVLRAIPDRPISFEVFSDDFPEMERQARLIASWGENVYVKIPVTNTRQEPSYDLVSRLTRSGVKLNVTALLSLGQVRDVVDAVRGGAPCCISVFAGRVADTGRDPVPLMAAAVDILKLAPHAELIWASPRELLNIFQADDIGCHIITVTNDILKKLANVGRGLDEYSLETVKMFYNDAQHAGFRL